MPLPLCACVCVWGGGMHAGARVQHLQTKNTVDRHVSQTVFAFVSSLYSVKLKKKRKKKDGLKWKARLESLPTPTPPVLQRNYRPSLTCCLEYCLKVNHSLVLIEHTSFAPHHLFICNSLLSWLLCFSGCHFPPRGCSEHFHVLFNYGKLIWWKGVHGAHSQPCIIWHVFILPLRCQRDWLTHGAQTYAQSFPPWP